MILENQKNMVATFDESVAIFQHLSGLNQTNEQPILIELVNFNSNFDMGSEYYIDVIQYTDDGNFNDETANDGIYTSIEKYVIKENDNLEGVGVLLHKSDSFNYDLELERYIEQTRGPGISLGCKVRTVTCPETSWWNTCWPLSGPCTCIEFYDCEVTVSFEIK